MDRGSLPLCDVHSHLVPAVDDGARSLTETLEAIGRMVQAGVGRVVTTPHLQGSLSLEPEALDRRIGAVMAAHEEARVAVAQSFPELSFGLGFEVMIDVPEVELTDPRLHLAGSSAVLVEWPRLMAPPGSGRVVGRMVASGVRPVIAHPERYIGMGSGLEIAGEWRSMGALLQVNHGSLVGQYGPEVRDRALVLLRRGWVDLLSSDFHGRAAVPIHLREAGRRLEEWGGAEQWELLTRVNPARVLEDEPTEPVPPLKLESGLWGRVRALFGTDR